MFELELIEILNRYKKSDKYEQEKIKDSITKLILEDKDKFNNFLNTQSENLDDESKKLLQICFENSQKINQINSNDVKIENNPNNNKINSDFQIIKNLYEQWLKEYKSNNSQPNQKCIEIINSIIKVYADEKIETINKILSIKDSNDFNSFKTMIKNLLRIYFTEKISEYRKSDKYKNLNFIKKIFKKKEILKLYDELGRYEFNVDKIHKLILGD